MLKHLMATREKITLARLAEYKQSGRKFGVLTCYDACTASLMEASGVEVLLVGDTAGEVILGLETTREVPADFLLHLTAAVRRGAPKTLIMGDLPYTARIGDDAKTAVDWGKRCRDEAGADMVKIEVTGKQAHLIEAMCAAGIPVVAHLGLLPQMTDPETGYRARGKDAGSALELIEDARRMEQAGANMLLLEAVASEAARAIATHTRLPVIGCVAGPHCDGTVVVLHDMIGWGGGHPPKATKKYENLADIFNRAFAEYVDDIHAGRFPTETEAIHMKPGEHEKLLAQIGEA